MVTVSLWILFLVISLTLLVRGSEMFVIGAKKMGSAAGMSKFAIGVLIVGFGTSIPELASSLAAAVHGAGEIAIANVVGSNITNILLIVGIVVTFGGTVIMRREIIRKELPIFLIATAFFVFFVYDGVIVKAEAFFLVGAFVMYLLYLFTQNRKEVHMLTHDHHASSDWEAVLLVLLGLAAIIFGAQYAVDMVVNIASYVSVPVGLISIAAIAIGTSLPELSVALQAMRNDEADIAVGSIFGSNAFNALVVVGVPGLILPLYADATVLYIGLPALIAASIVFSVGGLLGKMVRIEGIILLACFIFFMYKLATFCSACLT